MTNFHGKIYLQTSLFSKWIFAGIADKEKNHSVLSIYNYIYLFNIFSNSYNVIKRVLGVKNMKNSAKWGKKQVENNKIEITVISAIFSKYFYINLH